MAGSPQRYYLSIEDLSKARSDYAELSFAGTSPDSFASALQAALRTPALWLRWKALQPDPDAIDESMGGADPNATVSAQQADLHTDIQVVTSLSHAVLKHRLDMLVGRIWKLRDVAAA
jgi:hypothetical protein